MWKVFWEAVSATTPEEELGKQKEKMRCGCNSALHSISGEALEPGIS